MSECTYLEDRHPKKLGLDSPVLVMTVDGREVGSWRVVIYYFVGEADKTESPGRAEAELKF